MQNQHFYNLGLMPPTNSRIRPSTSGHGIISHEPYSSYGQLARQTPNLRIGAPCRQKSNYHDTVEKADGQIIERYASLKDDITDVKNNINGLKMTNKTLITKILSAETEKKKLKELIRKIELFLKSNSDDKKKVGIVS